MERDKYNDPELKELCIKASEGCAQYKSVIEELATYAINHNDSYYEAIRFLKPLSWNIKGIAGLDFIGEATAEIERVALRRRPPR